MPFLHSPLPPRCQNPSAKPTRPDGSVPSPPREERRASWETNAEIFQLTFFEFPSASLISASGVISTRACRSAVCLVWVFNSADCALFITVCLHVAETLMWASHPPCCLNVMNLRGSARSSARVLHRDESGAGRPRAYLHLESKPSDLSHAPHVSTRHGFNLTTACSDPNFKRQIQSGVMIFSQILYTAISG